MIYLYLFSFLPEIIYTLQQRNPRKPAKHCTISPAWSITTVHHSQSQNIYLLQRLSENNTFCFSCIFRNNPFQNLLMSAIIFRTKILRRLKQYDLYRSDTTQHWTKGAISMMENEKLVSLIKESKYSRFSKLYSVSYSYDIT